MSTYRPRSEQTGSGFLIGWIEKNDNQFEGDQSLGTTQSETSGF